MARFYEVDPQAVEEWPIGKYLIRSQYMNVYDELNKPRTIDDPLPGQEIWTGR